MKKFLRVEITALLAGATVYHLPIKDSRHGEAEIPMYFSQDGRMFALMQGATRTGRWTPIDGGYQLDWDGGLQGSRSLLEDRDGMLLTVNPEDGLPRTVISRIVQGDAETFASKP